MVCRVRLRRGMTLAELLVAASIMLLIAGATGTLAMTAHSANGFCQGQTACAQHGRVIMNRIERAVQAAVANESFPGVLIVSEQSGGSTLPSTLVVWSPTATAANPSGLPLISEIVVFSPDPSHPNQLLEIRSPTEATAVPAASDTTGWQTLTDRLKTSASTTKIVLTDRLKTVPVSGTYSDSAAATDLRGVVRFRRFMAPTDTEWSQYRAATKTWVNLNWPTDSYRTSSGTRVVACQTELHLVPGSMAAATFTVVPFFGSASLTYELSR